MRHLGGERRDEVDGRHAVAVDAVAVGRKGELARLHDADARKALVVDLLQARESLLQPRGCWDAASKRACRVAR